MQITWTNCADEMPPDDDTLVIIRWGVLEQHRIEPGSDSHKLLEEKEVFNNRYWTLYTSEKWEKLKND